MELKQILEFNFLNIGDFHLSVWHLIIAIFILTIGWILVWAISRIMRRYFNTKKVDPGRQYAFQRFLKYIIYTIALIMALDAIGVKVSVLWGGAAALLVGIGLGLQQTFYDLISGLILLIEGTVEVGDVIDVHGLIGTVSSIGIRTSKIDTRDRISILIPNSKLVGDNAINLSHNNEPTRFQVNVGIAYSSDVELVTKLLLEAAVEHKSVLSTPEPKVQFTDFGNSSLDLVLLFFSYEYLSIEFVKSELRYRIIQLFREHDVEIPFPQRDLWVRNADTLVPKNK